MDKGLLLLLLLLSLDATYVDWQELEWQARSRHDTIGSFEIV